MVFGFIDTDSGEGPTGTVATTELVLPSITDTVLSVVLGTYIKFVSGFTLGILGLFLTGIVVITELVAPFITDTVFVLPSITDTVLLNSLLT